MSVRNLYVIAVILVEFYGQAWGP